MRDNGTDGTAPEVLAERLLPIYASALAGEDFWDARIAAGARETGEQWRRRGGALDLLLDALGTMASRLIDPVLSGRVDPQEHSEALRRYGDACGRVTVELVRGFTQATVRATAAGDWQPDGGTESTAVLGGQLPSARAVVSVRVPGADSHTVESVFLRCGGRDAVSLLHEDNGCVLLPARSEEDALRLCSRVAATLRPHEMWAAVEWVRGAPVEEGRQVASDVLALVTALHLPPGVYRRRDVLVEYAAVRSPATASRLRQSIQPVMDTPVLRKTLEALVAEDGNRTRAAERLVIHRSTIDYRLQRIEQLTGQCPATVLGMRTLTTAYVLHSLAGQDGGADANPGFTLPQGA